MKNLQREDLHIISRHSNVTEQDIQRALKENIYHDKDMWQKFLRLFFITLGIGFTTAGIIFFFAYNWADLNKFVKLGLTEILVIATTIIVLLPKINSTTKNIILTGSSCLVGVLFAVFGQIYQTGANAYDFFLAWTLFITLWVVVSNFAPLWLLYIVLLNTTFFLYTEQVAKDWPALLVITLFFLFNTAILLTFLFLDKDKKIENVPKWFTYILALGSVTFATAGMIFGILDGYDPVFPVLIPIVLLVFGLGIWHGIQSKNGFYLSVIPLSIIIIISALLLKISEGGGMLLLVSLFIIVSVTLVIMNLINLQKKWNHEK
ncbi:DUF2157 domain-containing protein [Chryseobacterium antibioticum]|uniref:DUF2157 domain-containing protein n=1 Tax=Chryseobacterium pyrolae TaxID=2987481 RepID=A0ABT2IFR9_9FLAO|nr:DUF2157 domain-containing protein [Chryseobacterium pyrolae]MCT2407486.1 DUF2157 domain-containing protein [Chryseobacterium pyrolae]